MVSSVPLNVRIHMRAWYLDRWVAVQTQGQGMNRNKHDCQHRHISMLAYALSSTEYPYVDDNISKKLIQSSLHKHHRGVDEHAQMPCTAKSTKHDLSIFKRSPNFGEIVGCHIKLTKHWCVEHYTCISSPGDLKVQRQEKSRWTSVIGSWSLNVPEHLHATNPSGVL